MALTTEQLANLEVGQELFIVTYERKNIIPKLCKVEKIGNKFFYVDGRQYRNDDGVLVSNYTRDIELFYNEAEYKTNCHLVESWGKLRTYFNNQYSLPETLTIENIEAALKALNIQ